MPDNHDPAHTFRIERCDGATEYIAADYMIVDQNGCVRLFVREEDKVLGTLVALLPPHHGMTAARVANLITTEGLT